MQWIKERWAELSTKNGLAVILGVVATFAPPQYQLLVQGVAVALGLRAMSQPG